MASQFVLPGKSIVASVFTSNDVAGILFPASTVLASVMSHHVVRALEGRLTAFYLTNISPRLVIVLKEMIPERTLSVRMIKIVTSYLAVGFPTG